jgi:radical SAM protein with 4Fe4S-binding SPASM domain
MSKYMSEKSARKSQDVISIPVDQIYSQDSLTNNAKPIGWKGEFIDNTAQDSKPATIKLPGLTAPDRVPTGLAKQWRFGKTLLNLLRRPKIVNDLPIHLQMESTDACNLNCTTCSRDIFIDKAKLLDEKIWKKVIDEIVPTNINVSGIGEPFLHPDIFDIVGYAKSKGSIINCATNFTRIDGRYREIIDSGISQLKVSIDSTDRETFKAIRGEDYFDEIIDNVRNIVHLRDDLKKDVPGIRFNFAVQALNYKQAPGLIDLAAEVGVEGIYFQYLEYVDMEDRKGMLTGDMTKESLLEVLKETEKRAEEKGILTNLDIWWRDFDVFWNKMQPIAEFQPNNKACYFPWFSTWLSADGWIRPCPIMPWTLDEGRMGNLAEQSFSEIWNGAKYQELRAALARGERPTRSCKTCIPQSLHNILFMRSKLLPKK